MHTFTVSDVDPPYGPMHPVTLQSNLESLLANPFEACAANSTSIVQCPGPNMFVSACTASFAQHYPLVLSPDDVWLAIAQGFAQHVNNNAEALRSRFVRHEGKEKIQLNRDTFVKGSPANDWPGCFAEFSAKIREHVGKPVDMVVCDFSTTGPIERAASEVVLMDAMQAYFEYSVMTMCGIPQVTLLGTVADWKSVFARAQAMGEYDLQWWTASLLPALDEFVEAAAGKPNRTTWESFFKRHSMSGGDKISGWVNALFPYLKNYRDGDKYTAKNDWMKKDKWDSDHGGAGSAAYPSGFGQAPFVWNYHGTEYAMKFTAGFVGVSQDPTTQAVRPAIGWAVGDGEGEKPQRRRNRY